MIQPITNIDTQINLIRRGTERIIEEEELIGKLERSAETGKPLIVKLGADPTAPDLHLGHTVVFRKLRHFQQLGHQAVFLIGDFTGRIGDPTGRDLTRPPLSEEEVIHNAKTYRQQIAKILDPESLKTVFNSEWLKKLNFEDILRMTASTTMARLLEHNTFRNRFEHADSIRFNEMLYPFMQAYDSVALNADVELGGTDQTFNLTFGRDLQRLYGQEPQICITLPILPGTDGKQKMSKSLGNYIGIDEAPYIMYEKLMRMTDENIVPYFTLLTDKPMEEIEAIGQTMKQKPDTDYILQQKRELAYLITAAYHGTDAATQAGKDYGTDHRKDTPVIAIPPTELDEQGKMPIVQLLVFTKSAKSKNDARRLIQQGGVWINQQKVTDFSQSIPITTDIQLKVGKSFIATIRKEGD